MLLNAGPDATGLTHLAVSSATGENPVGVNSLVSAYGGNLAPRIEAAATGQPWPFTLDGVRLHAMYVSFGSGMILTESLASLIYVSPTQINYLVAVNAVLIDDRAQIFVTIERVGTPIVRKA